MATRLHKDEDMQDSCEYWVYSEYSKTLARSIRNLQYLSHSSISWVSMSQHNSEIFHSRKIYFVHLKHFDTALNVQMANGTGKWHMVRKG